MQYSLRPPEAHTQVVATALAEIVGVDASLVKKALEVLTRKKSANFDIQTCSNWIAEAKTALE